MLLSPGGGDSIKRMWDATTGKETDLRATIYLHYGEICDIATRREGTHVSVAIEGKRVMVVHLTGRPVAVSKLFMVGFGPPWDEAPHSIRFDRDMILWGAGAENDDGSNGRFHARRERRRRRRDALREESAERRCTRSCAREISATPNEWNARSNVKIFSSRRKRKKVNNRDVSL